MTSTSQRNLTTVWPTCNLGQWPQSRGERVLRQHHHAHLLPASPQALILALTTKHKPNRTPCRTADPPMSLSWLA